MALFDRLERVIRGLGGSLGDLDPDDLLRRARRGSGAEDPDEGAGAPRDAPSSAAGGGPSRGGGSAALSAEVRRAYANLELEPPSSSEEAKKAWRRLMSRYHPDRHQGDPRKAEVANKVAARLTEAYRVVREHLEAQGS